MNFVNEFDLFVQLYRSLDKAMLSLEEVIQDKWKLSFREYRILKMLEQEGSINMKRLAKELGLYPSMATNLVDDLEKKKLAQRQFSTSDRRSVNIKILAGGKKMLKNVEDYCISHLREEGKLNLKHFENVVERIAGFQVQVEKGG